MFPRTHQYFIGMKGCGTVGLSISELAGLVTSQWSHPRLEVEPSAVGCSGKLL